MTTTDPAPQEPAPGEPIMNLRGAGVDVDSRRVVQVIVGIVLVGLTVLVVVLFLAGLHRNSQITELHQHGVKVEVTVTACTGLLGGSGSNVAGYSCRGAFTINGHRYTEAIPGSTLYQPGTTLQGVTIPGDPALLSTAHAVANEHSSWRVFILPAVLLVVLLLLVGALVVRQRRQATSPRTTPSSGP